VVGDELGIVMGNKIRGFVSIEFLQMVYTKDDDAKNWNVINF
jgi:uncharacterized membrane-anchored protein